MAVSGVFFVLVFRENQRIIEKNRECQRMSENGILKPIEALFFMPTFAIESRREGLDKHPERWFNPVTLLFIFIKVLWQKMNWQDKSNVWVRSTLLQWRESLTKMCWKPSEQWSQHGKRNVGEIFRSHRKRWKCRRVAWDWSLNTAGLSRCVLAVSFIFYNVFSREVKGIKV